MALMDKYIFTTFIDLKTYLISKGFVFNNNNDEMRWNYAGNTDCYWKVDVVGGKMKMNFIASDGQQAFRDYIVDFTNNQYCGVIFIELENNGYALYLTPLPDDFPIVDLQITCKNGWDYDEQEEDWVKNDDILQNGLIICTPAEQDNNWRFTWRDMDSRKEYWNIDNGRGYVSYHIELPSKMIMPSDLSVILARVFLNSGYWSNNIYQQVAGEIQLPYTVFRVNGQKYIGFADSDVYRIPVFKLPPEYISVNDSSSTEEYSSLKTYHYGDYCIYNGLLWRCIQEITSPTPFDQSDWITTTVSAELMRS